MEQYSSCVPVDEDLVHAFNAGDSDALNQLVSRYLPRIRMQVRRYSSFESDREDLVQEGLIGLVGAVKSFDLTKNVSFRTYCSVCITSKILSGVRSLTNGKHYPMWDYIPIELLEETMPGLKSPVAGVSDPLDIYVRREETEWMQQQIKTLLSRLEQETLSLYLSGYSYQEMANLLNLSPKAVDNALQRVRRKLRDAPFS